MWACSAHMLEQTKDKQGCRFLVDTKSFTTPYVYVFVYLYVVVYVHGRCVGRVGLTVICL